MEEVSHISNWYSGKCVLITGATGFLGKALLEKLLRSCPEIKIIYVLLRSKRGILPEERLKTLINNPVFEIVHKQNPESFEKIRIINGDIIQENLGITPEDRNVLAQNVSVVFHSAATVKFTEPLNVAYSMNVVATRELMNLASEMKNLEAFVYMSTAFSNCNYTEVEEKFYDPPIELNKLETLLKCLDDSTMNYLTPKLLKDWPNTYTFTKACAENLILSQSQFLKIPAVIIRPSIVTAAWQEPIAGWIDNIAGPSVRVDSIIEVSILKAQPVLLQRIAGFFLGAAKGIIRCFVSSEFNRTFIPIDMVVNLTVAAAWYIDLNKCSNVPIFNCSTEDVNGIDTKTMKLYCERGIEDYPFENTIWYPWSIILNSRTKWRVYTFFTRTIPAYIIDIILFVTRNKTFAVKLSNKINVFIESYAHFTLGKWIFHSKNVFKIIDSLSEVDKKLFNFDMRAIEWKEYFTNYHLGIRRFLANESLDNLDRARIKFNRLKKIYYVLNTFILLAFFFIIARYIFDLNSYQLFQL